MGAKFNKSSKLDSLGVGKQAQNNVGKRPFNRVRKFNLVPSAVRSMK